MREENNALRRKLADSSISAQSRDELLEAARALKTRLAAVEAAEAPLQTEIDALAASIPNLTSDETPRGNEAKLVGYINEHPEAGGASPDRVWRSHVDIGSELSLLDFPAAATTSGWGWYFLLNEAAQLEQALVQYALSVAMRRGWQLVSPPSIVYSHIVAACGFQPRDANDEQQIYSLSQSAADSGRGKPELSLAATAEIPLAGMKANTVFEANELPCKRIAVSRCYRAEAGARGVDTKGLYRVHEFTKVEMFAWTSPDLPTSTAVFEEMLAIQTEILQSLGLHARILEMPSADLGASAFRKRDIEAWFPSRRSRDDGWGEVTSASICTDYQSRRLATRVKVPSKGNALAFPHTVNGTAMAIPRVLAALLENGWSEEERTVRVPDVLRPWMGGLEVIGNKNNQ